MTDTPDKPEEKPIDQRGKLAEEPFDVQVTRDKVLVRFRGRLVRTLVGADADEIRDAVAEGDTAHVPARGTLLPRTRRSLLRADRRAIDRRRVQLLVARKTGNFKRGNES